LDTYATTHTSKLDANNSSNLNYNTAKAVCNSTPEQKHEHLNETLRCITEDQSILRSLREHVRSNLRIFTANKESTKMYTDKKLSSNNTKTKSNRTTSSTPIKKPKNKTNRTPQSITEDQPTPIKIYSCVVFDNSRNKGIHLGEGYTKTSAKAKALQDCKNRVHSTQCPDSIEDKHFTCESTEIEVYSPDLLKCIY